jgi:hypothetical protein
MFAPMALGAQILPVNGEIKGFFSKRSYKRGMCLAFFRSLPDAGKLGHPACRKDYVFSSYRFFQRPVFQLPVSCSLKIEKLCNRENRLMA